MKKESKEVKETKSEPKEESSQATRREKSVGNVANLVQRMSTIGIPTGGFLPQPPPAAKSKKMESVLLLERKCGSLARQRKIRPKIQHLGDSTRKPEYSDSDSDNTQLKTLRVVFSKGTNSR